MTVNDPHLNYQLSLFVLVSVSLIILNSESNTASICLCACKTGFLVISSSAQSKQSNSLYSSQDNFVSSLTYFSVVSQAAIAQEEPQ